MPRKGPVPKRDVLPDPVYHSKTVTKAELGERARLDVSAAAVATLR